MNVLVTGGAGFIGSHLSELLAQKGHHVTVIDNLFSGTVDNLSNIPKNQLSVHNLDIRDSAEILPVFKNIDWVFHLAGLADIVPSIENPDTYYETNVTGSYNVMEACRRNKVKKVIYAASSSSYGIPSQYPTPENAPPDPQYPYALTKHMGEELVLHWGKVYKIDAVSLRLFNVFGPRSRTTGAYGAVFGVFLAQKLADKPLTVVGDGTQTRDFTYVSDVARAFVMAAESNVQDVAMNVGSGDHYSVNRIVELLECDSINIPKRPGEPDCTFADIDKISRLLNWKTEVSFEEGVKRMLEHIGLWKNAPVWDPTSIEQATEKWFQYLGK